METSINDIIGETNKNPNKTSLVVFLRSLGWPFCQEQIVQYNRIRQTKLLANGVDLVVVSIGKPEIGKKLIDHLEVENGEDWIFCDPENKLYDALELVRGIDTTFFSIETPLAFRDRFFGSNGRTDGMKDLLDVLGKWKDAVYIPPKQEQAFQRKFLIPVNWQKIVSLVWKLSLLITNKLEMFLQRVALLFSKVQIPHLRTTMLP